MDKNRAVKISCLSLTALGALLCLASTLASSAGFLILICALLSLFAAFFTALFLPFKNTLARKAAKILKILCIVAFIFGLTSFIFVQSLIVSGWPQGEPEAADVVIILGAGLRGEQMSYVLRSRVSLAAEYLLKHPSCIAVVSGGQGPDESITEALAMKRYLESQGIAEERIFMEDKSRNTEQNLQFSFEILNEKGLDSGKIAVLSNSFHLFRAKRLAGWTGHSVQTIGAPIPKIGLIPLNSYVREYFSIMFMFAKEII